MDRHNKSALKIAQFLENHPAVERVNYPGLETNLYYKRAKELFDGFGGMISFELKGGLESANQFLKKVTLLIIAPSLGGVESLVTLPATTSHSGMSPEERQRIGISESLVRMSVGIEDRDDLIADLEQALS
jgi:cystathionine beta-lyase/cystathionine gamma-synthase